MILKYLYFLQLNRYDVKRFLKWLFPRYFLIYKYKNTKIIWHFKNFFILIFSSLLYLLLSYGAFVLKINPAIKIIIIVFFLLNIFIFLIISVLIVNIIENKIYKNTILQLKNKLEILSRIKIIGVSGSSGKDSIIQIIQKILDNTFVLEDDIYPDDINFLQKIDKGLNKTHKFFIARLDSYKKDQIKKFCGTIKPNIGILMSVNEVKLEHFGNIQNTIEANFEIFENLKKDGTAIINLDNELIYENIKNIKVLKLIGITSQNKTHDLCQNIANITDLRIENNITFFTLLFFDRQIKVYTKLVGIHNLYNLSAAIICALEMGVDGYDIADKVIKIESIAHNLDVKKYGDLIFIDDISCNNVECFKEGLRFLSGYNGNKIVVTPGISQIGKKSKIIHTMLGGFCAKICDLIILVGESTQTNAIRQGALDAKFDKNKITRVKNFEEAYRFIHKVLPTNSTALFTSSPNGEYEL